MRSGANGGPRLQGGQSGPGAPRRPPRQCDVTRSFDNSKTRRPQCAGGIPAPVRKDRGLQVFSRSCTIFTPAARTWSKTARDVRPAQKASVMTT